MKEILTAIIGGLFSLAAAYVTWRLSRRPPEVGGFADIPETRIEGARGVWRGTLSQAEYPGGPVESRLEMTLDVKRATIVGDLTVIARFEAHLHGRSEDVTIQLRVRGGFYTDSLVKLDYKNTTPGILQFGTMILQLDARSSHMDGRLVGYGSYAERVIHGVLSLEKTV